MFFVCFYFCGVAFNLHIVSLNDIIYNFHTVEEFQVFLSNTNNDMVSSNYFYLNDSYLFFTQLYCFKELIFSK